MMFPVLFSARVAVEVTRTCDALQHTLLDQPCAGQMSSSLIALPHRRCCQSSPPIASYAPGPEASKRPPSVLRMLAKNGVHFCGEMAAILDAGCLPLIMVQRS
jgi:hypothetical protein